MAFLVHTPEQEVAKRSWGEVLHRGNFVLGADTHLAKLVVRWRKVPRV